MNEVLRPNLQGNQRLDIDLTHIKKLCKDSLVGQDAKGEGSAELAQRYGNLGGGTLDAPVAGEIPVRNESGLRMGELMLPLYTAGYLNRRGNLRQMAGIVQGCLVGHLGQVAIIPVPHGATARIQSLGDNLPLLGVCPVGVLQLRNAAPLVIG